MMTKHNSKTIAIYITTYNRLDLLKRAINSVLSQTIVPNELYVCDDGSTDGTREYLLSVEDSRIKPLFNDPPNQGACVGRNSAIFTTECEYISGLDDDDYFQPHRIENFLKAAEKFELRGEKIAGLFDSVVEQRPTGSTVWNQTPKVDYSMLRRKNAVGNQVFTKTAYLKQIGGFDPSMPALQDWDTWLRLTKEYGSLININSSSYIQVQDHGVVRISEKSSDKIRTAFKNLESKLAPVSWAEKVNMLDSLYAYKQVDPQLPEIINLLLGGKLRRVAQALKREVMQKTS